MDWDKHRKHKAAAKVHVALDLNSFIRIIEFPTPAAQQNSNLTLSFYVILIRLFLTVNACGSMLKVL